MEDTDFHSDQLRNWTEYAVCGDCDDCCGENVDCEDCDCGDYDCGDVDCTDCDCGRFCVRCNGGHCPTWVTNCRAVDVGYCCLAMWCPFSTSDGRSEVGGARTRQGHDHTHHLTPEVVVNTQPPSIRLSRSPPMYDIATAAVAEDAVDPRGELLEDPPPTYQEHMEMMSREMAATRMPPAIEDVVPSQPELRVHRGESGNAWESDRVEHSRPSTTLESGVGVGSREYEVSNTTIQSSTPKPGTSVQQ